MNEITFIYDTKESLKQYEDIFNRLLFFSKEILNIDQNLSLSVTFISKEKSIEMNELYRNKSYIADVISFPIDDEYNLYDQLDFKEIGDIFICFEEAQNKANKFGNTIETEMSWLFVHGLFHILGYDHETSDLDAELMFSLTNKVLAKFGVTYEME